MSFIPPPEFGPFIKHFLDTKHLTELDAEKITDIRRKTLIRWERGGVQRIQRGALEQFAKGFNLTIDGFLAEFEAYRSSIASDTAQATNCQPCNDETYISIPRDTTEAPASSCDESEPNLAEAVHSKRVVYYMAFVGVACVMLATSAIFALLYTLWIHSYEIKPISITGKPIAISGQVSCIDDEPVEGIWVDAVDGDHGWALWYKINSNGSEAAFNYVLRYGDTYNLHVGCGGSRQNWKNADYTENGSGTIQDHKSHFFTCKDPPPGVVNGSCQLKY